MPPVSDDELNSLLREWKPPNPPPGLEARVQRAFQKRMPLSWRWWLAGRFRMPVPLGVVTIALLIGLTLAMFRSSSAPVPPPQIIVRTRTVEAPVFREQPRP